MKKIYPLILALFAVACGKEGIKPGIESKLVDVTYVITSNTDRPFYSIIYDEADDIGNSKQKFDWMILGKGRFEKVVKIQDGFGAGLYVQHPESGDWSIAIYQGNERLDSMIPKSRGPGYMYIAELNISIHKK